MKRRRLFDMQTIAPRSIVSVFFVGIVAGVLTWLIALLVERYVMQPLFCSEQTNWFCTNKPTLSLWISLLLTQFFALIALVRLAVLRPLLVVIACLVTLWGFQPWLVGSAWWFGAMAVGILFALSYTLFTWINRLLSFPFALGISIIVVVLARLVFAAV